MTLGVVTVTYNAEAHLQSFLRCCLAQTHGDFELLVIDNASSDKSLTIANTTGDKRVELISNTTNIGYAGACNQGILHFARKGADHILFINNDTSFDVSLFGLLEQDLAKYSADAITPRITFFDDPGVNWWAGGKFVYWKGFQGEHLERRNDADNSDTPQWTEVASGCCVMFRMDVFRKIGLFDPEYFVYVEDTDIFLRMLRSRLRVLYSPLIVIAHKVSLSTGGSQSEFSIRHHQRNQVYIVRKHFRMPMVAFQLAILSTKAVFRWAIGRDSFYQCRLRMQALWAGMKMPLPRDEVRLESGGT